AKAQGKEAGRVPPEVLTTRAIAFLNETFLKKGDRLPWIEDVTGEAIYLNRAAVKEAGCTQEQVEKALAGWLPRQPGMLAAYTRTQLMKGPLKDDPIGEMVRLSFDPERSGDVLPVVKPYHQLSPPITSSKLDAYRAMHGTPHPYDTHVPLLVYGPRVRPGVRSERVTPQAMAAILTEAPGLPPAAQAEYP